ncbi:hypothetical protein CH352_02700 [Leptospira hartskeerlii]|uniref:Uncharacterized protein n=1 Tax=Leptospira hartskeerlii TaxID=2023177 RepID=A0A2M9XDJ0_9LEPT|nr:hypothetical protein [Leptospira hartskeerlii]PJZ25642.1 hypothetical protein CH357_08275 [Leptospira hartskeerlii]PJZ35534.1 hypothetical protein CH352_02700 [Leptospira hartskeerlii]
MFIGHYSVSFATKKAEPKTPLWATFVGVQFVDILFMIFILFGIEGIRFVPGFTEVNNFDLYYMPITHSLVGGIGWSILCFLIFKFVFLRSKPYSDSLKNKISGLIGLTVLSHYFLDLPMHTKDLPILFDSGPKIGFGLWHNRTLSIATEVTLTLIGLILYFRATKPGPTFGGKYGMQIFGGILLVLAIATPFFPPPLTIPEFSIQALVGYVLLAWVAGWLDGKRLPAES